MPSASAPYALPKAISKRLLDAPSSRATLSTWPPASSTTTVSGFRPRSFPAARTPAVMVLAVSKLMLTSPLSGRGAARGASLFRVAELTDQTAHAVLTEDWFHPGGGVKGAAQRLASVDADDLSCYPA